MNTENDTYKILRRVSYPEMRRLRHKALMELIYLNGNGASTTEAIIDFEKYGWTEKEYLEHPQS